MLFVLIALSFVNCFGEQTRVSRIIDGDTFETESGDKVRMIGINAPEMKDIFGLEAKQHLSGLIDRKVVDLIPDQVSKDTDRYQRLLRYVYLDGTDINMQMISDGFACAYLKYNFERETEYTQAQLKSSENNYGMWGSSSGDSGSTIHKESTNFQRQSQIRMYVVVGLVAILLLIGLIFAL